MKRYEGTLALLPPFLDFFAAIGGLSLAYFIRLRTDLIPFIQTPERLPPYIDAVRLFVVFAIALVIFLALDGSYGFRARPVLQTIPRIIWSTLLWLFAIVAYYALIAHGLFFSRLVLIYGAVATATFIILLRALYHLLRRALFRRGIGLRHVLLLGQTPLASRLAKSLNRASGMHVVGVLADKRDMTWEEAHPRIPFLGPLSSFANALESVDEVVVCDEGLNRDKLEELLDLTLERYRSFHYVPDLFEIHAQNIIAADVGGLPVMELKPTRLDGWGKIAKRIVDVIVSSIFLVILIPLFLLIALVIQLTSPGQAPIIGLTRVGKNRTFRLYKFRSMIPNAHGLKATLMQHNERKDGPMFKMKRDPRVTPFGRFLRKSRLDELPQLWNVLKAEMSLVGPRPHEPEEVAQYTKHQRKLLRITPGITGLAQVHGASDLSFDEEVRLDTYYIEQWSLLLDAVIVIRTFLVVLLGRGAA